MSDQFLQQLTAVIDVQNTHVFPVSDDPGGTATLKKATFSQLIGYLGTPVVGNANHGQLESGDSPTFVLTNCTGLPMTSLIGDIITATDGATVTINTALGNTQSVTVGGNRTINITGITYKGQVVNIRVIQDGTGGRTLTWADTINATPPDPYSGAGLSTWYVFRANDASGATFDFLASSAPDESVTLLGNVVTGTGSTIVLANGPTLVSLIVDLPTSGAVGGLLRLDNTAAVAAGNASELRLGPSATPTSRYNAMRVTNNGSNALKTEFFVCNGGTPFVAATITEAGLFGIGIAPTQAFHVGGSGTVMGRFESTTATSGRAGFQFYSLGEACDAGLNLDLANDGKHAFCIRSNGVMRFKANSDGVGFFNIPPAAQPAGNSDVLAGLVTLGLRAASSNPPLNLGTGAITCGAIGAAAITATSVNKVTLTAPATGSTLTIPDGATLTGNQDVSTTAAPTFASVSLSPLGYLKLWNSAADQHIDVRCASLQAETFTLVLAGNGDSARTLTVNGSATLDQSVATTSSPMFAGLTTPAIVTASGNLTVTPASGSNVAMVLGGAGLATVDLPNSGGVGGILSVNNTGSTATNSISELRLAPGTAPTIRYASIQAINDGSNNLSLLFLTGVGASITEKMRIAAAGNVAFGTTTTTAAKVTILSTTSPQLAMQQSATVYSTVGVAATTGATTITAAGSAPTIDLSATSGVSVNAGSPVKKLLTATATLDFGSIAAGATAELTITVTGCAAGDTVIVTPNGSPEANLTWCGQVNSANTATVRLYNGQLVGAVDPASRQWRATTMAF